ncbi:hypothetical protein WJX81_006362 [Elliptochloris bilobata]|uniref:Ribonuclease P/MRP protein subunit POP5 n=1 Tax=Elliptochloris bilobata TaxID=381761 RepID=A0AAW1QA86_9CHLO
MRFKNRYLLLELVWKDARADDALLEPTLLACFRQSIWTCFGDHGLGLALASLQVKFHSALTGLCIVRCSRDQHRQVWGALSTITEIRHRTVLLRLLHLGGTLASCQRTALAHSRASLAALQLTAQQARSARDAEARLQALEL